MKTLSITTFEFNAFLRIRKWLLDEGFDLNRPIETEEEPVGNPLLGVTTIKFHGTPQKEVG